MRRATYHVTVRITGTLAKLGAAMNGAVVVGNTDHLAADGKRRCWGDGARPERDAGQQAKALSGVGLAFITSPITSTVGGQIQRATTLNTQIVRS
jgi:hypothetical protein